jgi:hypothetical protein
MYEREPKNGDLAWEIWHARLQYSLDWRQKKYWNGDKAWNEAYDLFKGLHWEERDYDKLSSENVSNRIVVNITASTILSIGPFIMNNPSKFMLKPRKPGAAVSAQIQQDVLNYEWQHKDMQEQIRKCRDDAMIIGHAICKTGFTLAVDKARSKEDGDIVYDDDITEESPYIKRIDPRLFLFDPLSPEYNLETSRWCAEIFFQPIADILSNNEYEESVIADIKSGKYKIQTRENIFNDKYSETFNTWDDSTYCPESELGILFEVWDRKFNQVLTFAAGVKEPLKIKDNPYLYLKGEFPYKKMDYIPLPNEPYGVGIPYFMKHQQHELNRHRTAAFQHRRRFNRKYAVVKNAVDEAELSKLEDGPDGTIVMVGAQGAIDPIQDAPLSVDYERIEGNIKQDIYELTGSDSLFRGGNLPSRTTGTEVQTRSGIFSLKLDDRVKGIDDFIKSVGRQVLAHIKDNYITEKVVRIVGMQGMYWVKYNPQDIQDEVDIDVSTAAASKVDPQMDRAQRIQVLQTLMNPVVIQMVQAGLIKGVDYTELIKWVLESMNEGKDIGRFFQYALIPNQPLNEITPQQLESIMMTQAASGGAGGGSAQPTEGPPSTLEDSRKSLSASANTNGLAGILG